MDFYPICEIAVEHIIDISERNLNSKLSATYEKKLRDQFPQKIKVCVDIANEALTQNINPILAISIAMHETEFQYMISVPCEKKVNDKFKRLKRKPKKADFDRCPQGPLQAIPYFYCPEKSAKDCNLVSAGITAISRTALFISKDHGALDPYDDAFCVAHEAECGDLFAKYNRGVLYGKFKKGRSEVDRYARPILRIYNALYNFLDVPPTC